MLAGRTFLTDKTLWVSSVINASFSLDAFVYTEPYIRCIMYIYGTALYIRDLTPLCMHRKLCNLVQPINCLNILSTEETKEQMNGNIDNAALKEFACQVSGA